MPENSYDLIVIGAGPGGYVAAIRAAQLGLRVACIEKERQLGGTCLRVGCIPSKALLDASEKFHQATHQFPDMGIGLDNLRIDVTKMLARKDRVVDQLTNGIAGLFKKNKIERFSGSARFLSPTEIEVTASDGKKTLTGKDVLIATGSVPIDLPFLKVDGTRVVNSDQAIALPKVPKRLVVIGGGVIGVELGSVWSRLGAQVTILEMLPLPIPGADEEMARGLERALKKQGINFFFGAKVTGAQPTKEGLDVTYEWEGKAQTAPADVVLSAVGRKPYTAGLGAQEIGVTLDARGRIEVDGRYQTKVPHVYAVGDVITGPMLAHKAEEEGIACVELLVGKAGHVNYDLIPGVVYTSPELAWVGKTEEQCAAAGLPVKIGKFKFSANGRAVAMGDSEGLVKIIADARTDRVLGVHILGPQGSTIVAEATGMMEFGASSEDIARTCHAHPTLPEAVKEAALAVDKRAIHS